MERDTRLQHVGDDRERFLRSAAPPVFRSSLFTFPDSRSLEEALRAHDPDRFLYTRVSNPTTRILEAKVADLEGTEDAAAFASGMGAITAALLGLLSRGDHLVLQGSSYGPTLAFARGALRRFGVDVTLLPAAEMARLDAHLRPNTRLVYAETPASLTFDVVDLARVAQLARARGIVTACDNSWATPIYQQPARQGIDLVIHSGTKYIGGHSDIVMGLVAGGGAPFALVRSMAVSLGATLSPEDAFLAIRGLRTLPLRMARHEESALRVARWLEPRPRVARVLHPGLPSFPGHDVHKRQAQGSSGLFSFQLKGEARRFVDALKLFSIGVSWGGHESLVLPVEATAPIRGADDPRDDIPPELIRLSIGLEDPKDLIDDLERGFKAVED